MKNKTYNDIIIASVLTFAALAMELTVFFFNGLFSLGFFGIANDILITAAVMFAICFIPRPLAKRIIFTFVFLIITLIFVTDAIFSGFFPGFASVTSLKTAGNLKGAVDMGGASMTNAAWVVISVSAAAIAAVWHIKIRRRDNKNFFRISLSVLLASVIAVSSAYASVIGSLKNKKFTDSPEYYSSASFLYDNFTNSFAYASKFGYFAFRTRDLFFRGRNFRTKEQLDEFYASRENTYSNELTGIADGYNVITVTCETFDTRAVSKNLMPSFTSVMENSLVFDNYFVPTFFQGTTVNSEFLTLTSILPTEAKPWVSSVGDRCNEHYFGDYSLPGQLKKKGYKTYYAHLGRDTFYSRDKLMPNLGFDVCKFVGDLPYEPRYFDKEIVDMLSGIDFTEKFYADILTFSMHVGNEKEYATADETNPNAANYKFVCENYPNVSEKTKIYYTKAKAFDDFVAALMKKLADENVLENTVILFYPDHYMYMDDGSLYKDLGVNVRSKEIHRQFLTMYLPQSLRERIAANIEGAKIKDGFDSALSVPLLGSSADITPTVMNLVGGGEYRYFVGQDIFKGGNYAFFNDFTVTDGTYFYNISGTVSSSDGSAPDDGKTAELKEKLCSYIEHSLNSAAIFKSDYFAAIRQTE